MVIPLQSQPSPHQGSLASLSMGLGLSTDPGVVSKSGGCDVQGRRERIKHPSSSNAYPSLSIYCLPFPDPGAGPLREA